MATEQNKALIRQLWEAASHRGLQSVLDEFLAPDVVSHLPTSASPQPICGLAAWRQFVAAQWDAFPDLQVAVDEANADGDLVAVRVTARGTHTSELMGMPPTGRSGAFTGMEFFRIADGKIVEQWGQFDALAMLQQLGALPASAVAR